MNDNKDKPKNNPAFDLVTIKGIKDILKKISDYYRKYGRSND